MSKNLYPNSIRIGLMDPSIAQTWAQRILSDGTTVGSIKKGDTINHTTSQPIATGLFCQRIFGPCTDYTCACNHEKIRIGFNPNTSPPVCPECRVEWTHASVRRQFLGSIDLISPVTHKWFSDSRGAYIPTLLGITPRTFRNVKECKLFFPFSFEKSHDLAKYKEPEKKPNSSNLKKAKQSTCKPPVSSNLRAMHTLKLLIDPKKSLNTNSIKKLQLTENFRSFWVLSNPFFKVNTRTKEKSLSQFSDVCLFPSAEQFSTASRRQGLIPNNIKGVSNATSIRAQTLQKDQSLLNYEDKALYSSLQIKTQELLDEQDKSPKHYNFSSLIAATNWLTIEQKCFVKDKKAQDLSSLPKSLNSLFFRKQGSETFRNPQNFRKSDLSQNQNMGSVQVTEQIAGTLKLQNSILNRRSTYPLVSELNQIYKDDKINNTKSENAILKKETLKYVFVLAQKKTNKLSNFFLERFSVFTLKSQDKQMVFKNTKPTKNILIQDQANFLSSNLIKVKLHEKESFILNKVSEDYRKIKKVSPVFKKQGSRISNYKMTFSSNSKVGLSLIHSPLTWDLSLTKKKKWVLLSRQCLQCYASTASTAPYSKNILEKLRTPKTVFVRNFNGYHNLPMRPSYTQPEDYRRQFFKFVGNNSLIQKTDVPIFRYINSTQSLKFRNNIEKQRFTQKKNTSTLSPQAIEVYFSEAKSVAKEQTIKKILSQTGGGGLQTYLGLVNLGELVLILQNDLSEIAPRLARSYATRRVLLSIINDTSNSLNEALVVFGNSPTQTVMSNPGKTQSKQKKEKNDLVYSSVNLKLDEKKNVQLIGKNIVHQNRKSNIRLKEVSGAGSITKTSRGENYNLATNNSIETNFLNKLSLTEKIEILEKKYKSLKKEYKAVKKICSDFQNRKNNHKRRYKLAFQLLRTLSNPAGMTMSSVPVLPPGLRPIIDVPKIGPITADLNIRYRSLLFALRNLRELAYVDFRNAGAAQASVQEAVDDLLYTGGKTRREKPSSYPNLYKSLAMRLKGKHGRFRGNLLGKRVDYSGRSVIVVGPTLKIHQCGLPFEIAIKLFNPFLIRSLIQRGFCKNVYKAKQLLIRGKFKPLIWTLCKEVMSEHLVLLNRAPTLHRLGVQAFLPILVSGRAILLHPLVCTGFNADFDGDQMGVHVPLFPQARAEAWKMMWSRNNFLLPSSGEPVLLPSQDMVLGCYYLTSCAPQQFLLSHSVVTSLKNKSQPKDQFIVSEYGNWPCFCGTRLSMSLLSKPILKCINTKDPRVQTTTKQTTQFNFFVPSRSSLQIDTNKTKLLFCKPTNLILSLPFIIRISLDYFNLKINFGETIYSVGQQYFKNLSYLAFFPGSTNNSKILNTLQTLYKKQNLPSIQSQSNSPLQQQTTHYISEQSPKSLGNFNIFENKKAYFNILFFATAKTFVTQQKNYSQTTDLKIPLVGRASHSPFDFFAKFGNKNKKHAITYARVYNFQERQKILRNKQEAFLTFDRNPINIAQKQSFFFRSNTSKLWGNERMSFWSYCNNAHQTLFLKIGLIQWSYSPRFSKMCESLVKENNKDGFVKNQITVPVLANEPSFKVRGLGTFYAASNTNVLSFFLAKQELQEKQKIQNQEWPERPYLTFQILTIKTALNFYRKGYYGIQNIVWIHPNKILSKKNYINSWNSEIQRLESDGFPITTLELRITPFGRMRLLHPSGMKTFAFQNSLFLPTQNPLKAPIFDTFVRTTIGRLIFNNLLEEIENS